jgi:hypothetical protein
MFLDKLNGEHILSGVGKSTLGDGYRFVIDGKVYDFHSDEYDNYRDNCEVSIGERGGITIIPQQKVFIFIGSVEVIPKYDWKEDGTCETTEYQDRCLIEEFRMVDPDDSSLVIFSAYTEDWNDWYPCARMEYNPENIKCNQ